MNLELLTLIAATPPSPEESSEALKEAVAESGFATAFKIIAVVMLFVVFQFLRSRFQKRLAAIQEARTKPWEH